MKKPIIFNAGEELKKRFHLRVISEKTNIGTVLQELMLEYLSRPALTEAEIKKRNHQRKADLLTEKYRGEKVTWPQEILT
jgi:hypothetical protein